MKRIVMIGAVAGLAMSSRIADGPDAACRSRQRRRQLAVPSRNSRSKASPSTSDRPELDTDHPVFPGQTHAPYHKTTDVAVTTIASGLDNPWAVALLPSGRFLITEKPGRIRILNRDGSALHTITANMPPVYFRGQAGPPRRRAGSELREQPQNLLRLHAHR